MHIEARLVGVGMQFDIGDLIFVEIYRHAKKVNNKLSLPYPSHIFQILFVQNSKIVKTIEKYEKMFA